MKETAKKQYLYVIIACGGLAACALGFIVNMNGIFFGPVSEALFVGRGAVSLAATLTAITTGFMGPASVWALRKFPIKKIMMISIFITVLSTVGMAFTGNIWVFDILSVFRGASSAFFGIPVITLLMGNWFVKSRGMLTGLVMSFSGVVGAVLSPILSGIISTHGYRYGYLVCAGLMVVFSLPAIFLLEVRPEDKKMTAYGDGENTTKANEKKSKRKYFPYQKTTFLFLVLLIIAFLCQSICSISQHLAGYAQSVGQSSMTGALMISAAMIGNIAAKFTVGVLSDLFGAFKSAFALIGAFLFGLVLLLWIPNQQAALLVGSFLLGTSYACALMLSNLTFAIYGTKQYGEAYAFLMVVLNIGGALAITIVGYGYDLFHSYKLILGAGIGMAVISILLILVIGRWTKSKEAQLQE